MANPQRAPDPQDPMNPVPPLSSDPFDQRMNPANTQDPAYDNRVTVQERSGGTGVLIAAVVLVLAIVAYFMFAPGTTNMPAPDQPTTTEPAAPAPTAPEPSAAAPVAPEATAPATPAEPAPAPAEPNATAPATLDATGTAPAPAEPAPAQ